MTEEMGGRSMSFLTILVIIIISLIIFLVLMNKITSGKTVSLIICGMLFWVPGAASFMSLSQGCAAIPA